MLSAIIKLIFPPKCIFCSKILPVTADIDICESCYREIPFTGDRIIRSNDWNCDYAICVCRYTGLIKNTLIRYKFYNKASYYRALTKLLAEKTGKMTNIRKFDIILSVPLHKDKEKLRGFNQSYLISRELSRETGIPEKSYLLSRIRNTETQSLLIRNSRFHNVKGAFKVNNAQEVKGKSILLVDDVMTTGFTLSECSRVLKDAGAKTVVAAVIASGRIN